MLKASEFRYYRIGLCPAKYTRYVYNAGFRAVRRTFFYTQTEHTYYLPKVVLSKPPVDIAQQVIQDMQARREFGIKKYGRPVLPHNGRHALKDAYEEVLDLAVYLKQQLVEDGQTQPSIPGDVKK